MEAKQKIAWRDTPQAKWRERNIEWYRAYQRDLMRQRRIGGYVQPKKKRDPKQRVRVIDWPEERIPS